MEKLKRKDGISNTFFRKGDFIFKGDQTWNYETTYFKSHNHEKGIIDAADQDSQRK